MDGNEKIERRLSYLERADELTRAEIRQLADIVADDELPPWVSVGACVFLSVFAAVAGACGLALLLHHTLRTWGFT